MDTYRTVGLRVRMVVVALLAVVLGVGSLAFVGGLLFLYYSFIAILLVATVVLAILVVALLLPVPLLPTATSFSLLSGALALSVLLAGLSTVARLGLLVAPSLRGERGEAFLTDSEPAPPAVQALVTRVAQVYDVPAPRTVVLDTDTPEAFAIGFRPATTTLALSTGVVEALSTEELEAVVAHELAHVVNRDTAVMSLVALPLAAARTAVTEGRAIDWDAVEAGWDEGGNPVHVWKAATVLYVLLYPVAFCGRILLAALSRSRESVADRAAAQVTGSPAALASALTTLDSRLDAAASEDLRGTVAALSILPPATHERPGYFPWLRRWLVRNVYHTHPPTESRIEALRALEREAETAGP